MNSQSIRRLRESWSAPLTADDKAYLEGLAEHEANESDNDRKEQDEDE